MDIVNPEIQRLFEAKAMRRKQLSRMPFPEKVKAVVRMQEMAAPLLRQRGKAATIWRIADHS